MDDALYYFNSNQTKEDFEKKLIYKIQLGTDGEAKWYLGMGISQNKYTITLDQNQYAKNITSRLEKNIKNLIKGKESPFTSGFILTKDDSPKIPVQVEEIKRRFKNLHYRSAISE